MLNALEIEILTKYLGADQAQAAATDLEKLRQGSRDAGAATDATIPKMEDAAKASEHLGINHRALHIALREIASQSPITGASLEIGLLGTVGAIIAVVQLFRAAKGEVKEYSDELDAAGEAAAQPLDSGVVGLQEAWKTATEKLSAYYSALETAGEGKDPIDEQITNIKKRDEIEYEGIKKIIEALGKEEEAQIRVNDAKNPAKLKTDLDELHKRQQANLDQLDDWKDSRTEGALLTERAMRQNDQDAANDEVQKASAISQAADLKLKNNQTEIDNLTKQTANLTPAEISKLPINDPRRILQERGGAKADFLATGEKIASDYDKDNPKLAAEIRAGYARDAKTGYADVDRASAELKLKQDRLAHLNAEAQETQKEKDNADTRLKNATDRGTKDANRVDEINTELPNVIQQDDQKQGLRDAATKLPQDIKNVLSADEVYNSGKKLDATQNAAIVAARDHFEKAHLKSETFLTLILEVSKKSESQDQKLDEVYQMVTQALNKVNGSF